ncbi:MAG: LPXTG cell wall anchor domain-containing protein, partial [Nanoarchaeota archaeon]|nr:LPXTG cell wall anchor domain-containing protein [Nanoarchaeota archaeon]
APETKLVEPSRNDSGFVDLQIFGNSSYQQPADKTSKTPFIFVGLLVLVLAVVFLLSRKKKKEQTFDQYLEEMRKRRP